MLKADKIDIRKMLDNHDTNVSNGGGGVRVDNKTRDSTPEDRTESNSIKVIFV